MSDGRCWACEGREQEHTCALRESLARGMEQAARGELHDLGDFTQYLDDEDDEDPEVSP